MHEEWSAPVIDDLPFEGVPEPTEAPRYSDRFVKALRVAAIAHGGDDRKGSAIAALLHDVLEDVTPTDAAIRTVQWFGDRVFRIVELCTDGMSGPDGKKAPSLERKAGYIARLKTGDHSVLLMSASDKLHNGRLIVADLRTVGDEVWERFNVTKEQQLAYYAELAAAFEGNPAHHVELVAELDRTVAEMHRLAGRPYMLQAARARTQHDAETERLA